jgi:Flp pilus assembly protein TadD
MMTIIKISTACFLMVSLFMVNGCSSSSDGDGDKSPEQLVAEGWQAFRAKNYSEAASKFDEAANKDPHYVEAYDGAGWSYAKLNSLTSAENRFLTGLAKDSSHYEIKAGLAFLYHAQKRYNESAAIAENLLSVKIAWTFRGDTTISNTDVRLLLAQNYFAAANYSASLVQVQVLNPAFTADVSTVSGQAALAQEIERLRTIM